MKSKTKHNVSSPPAWYIHHRGTGRDRRQTRDACIVARAECRAGGEVETEPPTDQHRHGATWDWH
jgi:hypothetical protein